MTRISSGYRSRERFAEAAVPCNCECECVGSMLLNMNTSSVPVKKSWFIRLNPPRPTFDQDLNEEEGKLMNEHFLYWKDNYEKGVCQFGGPVLDARGVYGVLAIWAADKKEARALADADPGVKAGILRPEVAEMRVAYPPPK